MDRSARIEEVKQFWNFDDLEKPPRSLRSSLSPPPPPRKDSNTYLRRRSCPIVGVEPRLFDPDGNRRPFSPPPPRKDSNGDVRRRSSSSRPQIFGLDPRLFDVDENRNSRSLSPPPRKDSDVRRRSSSSRPQIFGLDPRLFDVDENRNSRSLSPPPRRASNNVRRRSSSTCPAESRIVCVEPTLFGRDESKELYRRVHCLDSVTLFQERLSETMVMTKPVNHVETHTFETLDFKFRLDKSKVMDTNGLCKCIAYRDHNTNVNHIISFDHVYEFEHVFEENDPDRKVDENFKPDIDIEKQVEMKKVEIVEEDDKQFADSKFVYHFHHKIRVYCPHFKLQTWSTDHRPSEVIDFCDCDPYLSSPTATAFEKIKLQVHYQRITHYIRLVHLLCRPIHIQFNPIAKKKQQQQQDSRWLQIKSCFR